MDGRQTPGATKRLAGFLAGLRFEDLPGAAIEAAKVMLLDLVGCALGAQGTEEVRISREVVGALGGAPECSVIGARFRTSPQNAAFLNGLSAHVIELDDTHRDSITHVGAGVIPAALAIAEREVSSGRDLIIAIVAGYEATLRVANAVQPSHWRRGFLSMGTCGTFGAATAAAHLLGLDAAALANALGLAGIQAAGLNSSIYGEGDMGKRLCPSHAASAGILSALFAQKGFTGSSNVIEQQKGFCEAFSDQYDLDRVTAGFGDGYEILRTSLKPYSCCRYNHAPIDALAQIIAEEAVEPGAIERVRVRTYDVAASNRPHRTHPNTLFDAKMSIPFSLAVAALRGGVGEHDFTADLIDDPELCAFAERVVLEADPEMSRVFPKEWPAEVRVFLKDGRSFTRSILFPKGEPEAPMTRAEIERKFRDLACAAVSDATADAIVAEIAALDHSTGVERLFGAIRDGLIA